MKLYLFQYIAGSLLLLNNGSVETLKRNTFTELDKLSGECDMQRCPQDDLSLCALRKQSSAKQNGALQQKPTDHIQIHIHLAQAHKTQL